jgi:tetratricopeptide (TPR) repeat protein
MNQVLKRVPPSSELNLAKIKYLLIVFISYNLMIKPVLAKQDLSTISSIYFNSENSFVIETANLVNLKPESIDQNSPESFTLNFSDVELYKNLATTISSQDFQLELKPIKSNPKAIFKKYDRLQVLVKASTPNQRLNFQTRVLLSGFASQYKLSTQDLSIPKTNLALETNPVEQSEPTQQISPNYNQLKIAFNQDDLKASQEFLERINKPDLLSDNKFITDIHSKLDIVALEQIAQILDSQGQILSAELAFRKILSLDPNNHKALIKLAELSQDPTEKNKNYLQALDQNALDSLASLWAQEKKPDSPAKAILLRQISILKDPQNPELRLECARLYESMGFAYYTLSAKRYLESAVLAKTQYLSGNLQYENTLRTATESLIRILSQQGDEQMAIKYCQSYLDLGFRRFVDGKPIVAVIKELQAHQNPFRS